MNPSSNQIKILAGVFSLVTAGLLAVLKLWVGVSQGSLALLASALDSGLDFLTSSVNLYALHQAARPADSEHRYGYGKAEAIAGLFQSLLVAVSGGWILFHAARHFLKPKAEIPEISSLYVMLVSLVLTTFLVLYQRSVIRKTGSLLVSADHLHYVSDLLGNLLVLLSVALAMQTGWDWVDPLAGAVVSLYLLKGAWEIFKKSTDILMDRDLSHEYRDSILRVVKGRSPQVLGYHDLRTRSAGERRFLEFHLEMPKNLTLEESHKILDSILDELKEEFPYTEVLIHPDPVEVNRNGRTLLDREAPRFY
ncbi:cation transporter [Leptospira fletcheri]|uniref:Cation transporter n=1 Tax=Leptospira fletcheri TaxID=2484981 RepID=A0A4R9GGT4_9LEPT|nr:cation diffusion facilitator family transporter [Leptospira fletcheri]TGK11531.1 cation transporter [Leptospira fletcheri]